MTSEPKEQVPLEFSRGTLVAFVVVLSIGWFGLTDRRGHNGAANVPGLLALQDIVGIEDYPLELSSLGLQINQVENCGFFLVGQGDRDEATFSVSFINRNDSVLGQIKRYSPQVHAWPPEPIDFGMAVNLDDDGFDEEGEPEGNVVLDMGPMDGLRVQVQTIQYDGASITWASPRKSPAWPLRIHIGKCTVAEQELLITVYEMAAKDPVPNYQSGPIADIARALRPL